MTTVVIVQARWASSRFPGKVMKPLGDGTVLSEFLRRATAIKGADSVTVAVPDDMSSDPIVGAAVAFGVNVARGPELDVLGRFLKAAREADASTIVRVTSDCPLADPRLCDAVIEVRAAADVDYASNNMLPGFPHGLDCECFTREALETAALQATSSYDREHVTPWLRRHDSISRAAIHGPGDRVDDRWTLDYPEDLAFLQAAWPLIDNGSVTAWRDVLRRLDRAPHVADINRLHRIARTAQVPG